MKGEKSMMGMLGGVDIFFCFAFFFVREECLKKKILKKEWGFFWGVKGSLLRRMGKMRIFGI